MPTPSRPPDATWACTRRDGTRAGAFLAFYPDGAVAARGNYRDGLLDGPWQRLDPSGTVLEEGSYDRGWKHGTWRQRDAAGRELGSYTLERGTGIEKRWYASGALYSETPLRAGTHHGVAKTYDDSGKPLSSTRYVAGLRDGPSSFGSVRDMRFEENFRGGVRYGVRKVFHQTQLLADERFDRLGRLTGPWTSWRSPTVKRIEGQYAAGRRTGRWVWRDREDRKEREGDYVAGKRHGDWLEWSEDKLTWSGRYSYGRPNGTFETYAKNGAVIGSYTMRGGTGWVLTFHTNGKPSSRTQLVGGVENGAYQELTRDGKVVVEGTFAAGARHGVWKRWDADGALLLEQPWNRGLLDGTVKKYAAGALSMTTSYSGGRASGKYAEFYPDGRPAVTGSFVDDHRAGTWTHYAADGAVLRIATYRAGVLDGPYRELVSNAVDDGAMVAGRRSGEWSRTDANGNLVKMSYRSP